MRQIGGYVSSATLALVFYIVWDTVFIRVQPDKTTWGVNLEVAIVFSIVGGFGPALALMSLPWILAVWGYRKLRCYGQVYFAGIGAVLLLVIGCATASLFPKPFFIEDQTFIEGIKIAVERQGICFFLAGAFCGFSYWFLSERQVTTL